MKCNIPCSAICSIVSGIVLTIVGIEILTTQLLTEYLKSRVIKELSLVKGTLNYEVWQKPMLLNIRAYIFHVENPDGVMQGEPLRLVERGPYCYTELIEKEILAVDEEADQIVFLKKVRYDFDKRETGNLSMKEELTVLNFAYLGTINLLATFPPSIMKQYGDNIGKLFPDPDSIFVKGTPADILFDGLKLSCNPKKFPEMKTMCQMLKSKKPAVLKETNREGIYLYSYFGKLNESSVGPFNLGRGLKNISTLSEYMAYQGKTMQKIWNGDECNRVHGRDMAFWPPMMNGYEPMVKTFEAEVCRSMSVYYTEEAYVNGLKGGKYVFLDKTPMDCYCPVVKKEMQCLPKGLFDVTKCQELPIIISEPHFLHGDPRLLEYAKGLKPEPEHHGTYLIVEPLTGAPLTGSKKTQINMKLSKQPVDLLANVSEGYFPLVWYEEWITPAPALIAYVYQLGRLRYLVGYLQALPLILGVHLLLATLYLHPPGCTRRRRPRPVHESVLIMSNFLPMNAPPRRPGFQ